MRKRECSFHRRRRYNGRQTKPSGEERQIFSERACVWEYPRRYFKRQISAEYRVEGSGNRGGTGSQQNTGAGGPAAAGAGRTG